MLLKNVWSSRGGVSGSGLLGFASGRSFLNSSGEFSDHLMYKGDEKKEASFGPNEKNSLFFGSGGGSFSFLPMVSAADRVLKHLVSSLEVNFDLV